MNSLQEQLDEILRNFAKRVEQIPRGKTYGWEDDKAAILKLMTDVIGEDETNPQSNGKYGHDGLQVWVDARNQLRAEQRRKLEGK